MAEYRIDELARAAGSTVRNVRAYQDRGLLPPPRREGRVGVYTDAHLARLGLIGRLLERGYTLANIAELLGTWERGRDLGAVLGLEEAVSGPWTDESPETLDGAELAALFGGTSDPAAFREAIRLGFFEPDGEQFRVPSPRLLRAGAELHRAGVPLAAVLEHAVALRDDVDRIAHRFVTLFEAHVWNRGRQGELPTGDLTRLVERLRPMAEMAVDAELALAMQRHATDMLGDQLSQLGRLPSYPPGSEPSRQ